MERSHGGAIGLTPSADKIPSNSETVSLDDLAEQTLGVDSTGRSVRQAAPDTVERGLNKPLEKKDTHSEKKKVKLTERTTALTLQEGQPRSTVVSSNDCLNAADVNIFIDAMVKQKYETFSLLCEKAGIDSPNKLRKLFGELNRNGLINPAVMELLDQELHKYFPEGENAVEVAILFDKFLNIVDVDVFIQTMLMQGHEAFEALLEQANIETSDKLKQLFDALDQNGLITLEVLELLQGKATECNLKCPEAENAIKEAIFYKDVCDAIEQEQYEAFRLLLLNNADFSTSSKLVELSLALNTAELRTPEVVEILQQIATECGLEFPEE